MLPIMPVKGPVDLGRTFTSRMGPGGACGQVDLFRQDDKTHYYKSEHVV